MRSACAPPSVRRVNCAAIPRRADRERAVRPHQGSFTSAHETKIGKFQKADGGTLFLDEVGDMSLRTQSKVLRVLEEQALRAGGRGRIHAGGRARGGATNKHWRRRSTTAISARTCSTASTSSPSSCRRCATGVKTSRSWPIISCANSPRLTAASRKSCTVEAYDVLTQYQWPGNVRRLKNLIERIVILTPGAGGRAPHPSPPVRRQADRATGRFGSLQE